VKGGNNKNMDEKDLKEIREILLNMRRKILEGREEALYQLSSGRDEVLDEGERAFIEEADYLEMRFTTREDRLLRKVEDALKRIEEGKYGICEVCGGEIDVNRLKLRPVTTMCIKCKTEQEKKEELEKKLKRKTRL
jgi:DnaK suppressor protein